MSMSLPSFHTCSGKLFTSHRYNETYPSELLPIWFLADGTVEWVSELSQADPFVLLATAEATSASAMLGVTFTCSLQFHELVGMLHHRRMSRGHVLNNSAQQPGV
jgi:hypothetical protein